MRITVGAPVIAFQLPCGLGAELYHLPAPGLLLDAADSASTLCGLSGLVYVYAGPLRRRRMCSVCRDAAPGALQLDGSYDARRAA